MGIADKVLHEASPMHSFGLRTNLEKPFDTPGLFASHYRNLTIFNLIFYFPAPNIYKVDIADKVLHENSPRHSFGHRTNLEKPLDTPG